MSFQVLSPGGTLVALLRRRLQSPHVRFPHCLRRPRHSGSSAMTWVFWSAYAVTTWYRLSPAPPLGCTLICTVANGSVLPPDADFRTILFFLDSTPHRWQAVRPLVPLQMATIHRMHRVFLNGDLVCAPSCASDLFFLSVFSLHAGSFLLRCCCFPLLFLCIPRSQYITNVRWLNFIGVQVYDAHGEVPLSVTLNQARFSDTLNKGCVSRLFAVFPLVS